MKTQWLQMLWLPREAFRALRVYLMLLRMFLISPAPLSCLDSETARRTRNSHSATGWRCSPLGGMSRGLFMAGPITDHALASKGRTSASGTAIQDSHRRRHTLHQPWAEITTGLSVRILLAALSILNSRWTDWRYSRPARRQVAHPRLRHPLHPLNPLRHPLRHPLHPLQTLGPAECAC